MSFQSYITYGYGICTDDISGVTVERLNRLLEHAPKTRESIVHYFRNHNISKPSVEDYYAPFSLGLAELLETVIREVNGISLCACQNYDGDNFLLYQPCYPWEMNNVDYSLTTECLDALYRKYINLVGGCWLHTSDIFYCSVENGG